MTRTQELYLKWLCAMVGEHKPSPATSFSRLLTRLHETRFKYTHPMDARRARDGEYLRYNFSRDTGELEDELQGPCSMLEMMVALAIKCEEYIMVDPAKGDRTSQWFWTMIKSLGLNAMTDVRYNQLEVDRVLKRFFDKTYDTNGKGGLFIVRTGDVNMRRLHIWDQLLAYINTIM